jgi:hypothetical protein
MRTVHFAPFALFVGLLLSSCGAPQVSSPAASTVGTFNPSRPFLTASATSYATPDAAEIKRGEDLENSMRSVPALLSELLPGIPDGKAGTLRI